MIQNFWKVSRPFFLLTSYPRELIYQTQENYQYFLVKLLTPQTWNQYIKYVFLASQRVGWFFELQYVNIYIKLSAYVLDREQTSCCKWGLHSLHSRFCTRPLTICTSYIKTTKEGVASRCIVLHIIYSKCIFSLFLFLPNG